MNNDPGVDILTEPVDVPTRIAAGQARQTVVGSGYRVQLDGIRAFAVMMVLVQHYLPITERWARLGSIAVRIFFVLSGFLITRILLAAREKAERADRAQGRVLLAFYGRRFLRIFPLYYAVIFITLALGSRPMRESYPWHLLYLSNVFFFIRGTGLDAVTHLWSLSVEEQFYLIWPVLLLFVPMRWMLRLIVLTIAMGPLFRASLLAIGKNEWQAAVLTPSCFDTLGAGAMLAYLSFNERVVALRTLQSLGRYMGIPLALLVNLAICVHPSKWWAIPFDTSLALASVWLIYTAYEGFGGITGRILRLSPIVYLGAISYGIYLIHNFAGGLAVKILKLNVRDQQISPTIFIILCAITIALAALSWHFFEAPLNRLKRFIPYV